MRGKIMKKIISSIAVILLVFCVFTSCETEKSSVTAIYVDGEPLSGFRADQYEYYIELKDGRADFPTVTVTYTGKSEPVVTAADQANSMAKIELGNLVYKVFFTSSDVEYKETYLQNTYHKLAEEKKLNIGFIGGSITAGVGASSYEHCWAGTTEKWFRDNYPDAVITSNNAAFGGIGTDFNAFRTYSELNLADSEKAPDLLFVECSLNDAHIKTSSDTVKGYTEAMIRMVNKYAPECDIIYVFTSDYWRGNKDFEQRLAAMEVLDAYGIRYINVGGPLFDKIIAENGGEMPTEPTGDLMMKYFILRPHLISPRTRHIQFRRNLCSEVIRRH